MQARANFVLGFNSPCRFAAYQGRVFVPAANGIVIVNADGGDSILWQPTSGQYEVDQIAVSKNGLLCFTERRLNVALHVYNAGDLRKVRELHEVARVGVQSMSFAADGDALFLLVSVPTPAVNVISVASLASISLTQSVPLPNNAYVSVEGTSFGPSETAAFLLTGPEHVTGFVTHKQDGSYVECFDVTNDASTITAAVITSKDTVIFATESGAVLSCQFSAGEGKQEVVNVATLSSEFAITSLHSNGDNTLFTCRESNVSSLECARLNEETGEWEVQNSVELPCKADRVLSMDQNSLTLVIGTKRGLFTVNWGDPSGNSESAVLVAGCIPHDAVSCHAVNDGTKSAVVFRDGSFAVVDEQNSVTYFACGADTQSSSQLTETSRVTDSCVSKNLLIMVHEPDHRMTVYDVHTGRLVFSTSYDGDTKPTKCAANASGCVIVFDERTVLFHRTKADKDGLTLTSCGIFNATPLEVMSGVISSARGLTDSETSGEDDTDCFLVSCSNGEVYLVRVPGECSCDVEHAVDSVLLGMWRLDFPLYDFIPCYVSADVINLLVHSLDKDTKVYALDRRQGKERKDTAIRPYFLMRDHESGGYGFCAVDDVTICSAGRDGRLVLRNVAPYQGKLAPIPTTKEKRNATSQVTVCQFTGGGVSSIAGLARQVVCISGGGRSGNCPVVKYLPLPLLGCDASSMQAGSWTRRSWCVKSAVSKDDSPAEKSADGAPVNSAGEPSQAAAAAQSQLIQDIAALQVEWTAQMRVAEEVGVTAEELLLEAEKARFEDRCADAVVEMRTEEYYAQLENQFKQELIKEKFCKTMDVPGSKLSSVAATDISVYNFGIAKQSRPALSAARKVAFLRTLQEKAKQKDTGYTFGTGQVTWKGSLNAEDLSRNGVGDTATVMQALWSSTDVYTRGRAAAQAVLLKGLVLSVKETFNREYNALKQRKHSTLSAIDDRTHRCVQILRQLGNEGEELAKSVALLFAAHVDSEEDANALFTVTDDELDECVRAHLPQKEGAAVCSPENEAALKRWMDGLEKDVEVVRVTVKAPDFADEEKEAFVPLDERTDLQVRLFEEYEKKLKEETEAVEARKESLRNELKALQQSNAAAAKEIDESIAQLRARRIMVAGHVHETELMVVQLVQHCTTTQSMFSLFKEAEGRHASAVAQARHVEVAAEMKQGHMSASAFAVTTAWEDVRRYAEEMRDLPPFTDSTYGDKLLKRFARWKKRFDDGKADAPNVAKPPEDCPTDLWELYFDHCESLLALREKALRVEEQHRLNEENLQRMEEYHRLLLRRTEEIEAEKDQLRTRHLACLLDTTALYTLHQGQIQDEAATIASDFESSSVRWVADVEAYNSLILASSEESGRLRDQTVKRQQRMKELEFESKRLQYCVGTLQLELRQLHTLRVTRLMQEWLAGDSDVSEEKTLNKIDSHIRYVNESMQGKVAALERTALRLRGQLSERAAENTIVARECESVRSTVRDTTAIQGLVQADGSVQYSQRARAIYEASELEELARSQQEELIRLKREVDRQRERTFPSFAVVSKQKM